MICQRIDISSSIWNSTLCLPVLRPNQRNVVTLAINWVGFFCEYLCEMLSFIFLLFLFHQLLLRHLNVTQKIKSDYFKFKRKLHLDVKKMLYAYLIISDTVLVLNNSLSATEIVFIAVSILRVCILLESTCKNDQRKSFCELRFPQAISTLQFAFKIFQGIFF